MTAQVASAAGAASAVTARRAARPAIEESAAIVMHRATADMRSIADSACRPVLPAEDAVVKGAYPMANVPIAKRPRRKKKPCGKPKLIRRPPRPALRLTPTAWAKLLHLRDAGPTEIGGFGVSAENDPLLVEDVALVRQRCDWGTVHFDDGAVADFFDVQVGL